MSFASRRSGVEASSSDARELRKPLKAGVAATDARPQRQQPAAAAPAIAQDVSQNVRQSVKTIQQRAADIRKEARVLSTAQSYNKKQGEIDEQYKQAKALADRARIELDGLVPAAGGDVTHQKLQQMKQQKLKEDLLGALTELEAAWKEYQKAKIEREQQDAPVAFAASRSGSGYRKSGNSFEMGAYDGAAGDIGDVETGRMQQAQQTDVTDAEVETHAEIVAETVNEIVSLSGDVQVLHRMMTDLADYTSEQGQVLDTIEANMSTAADNTSSAQEQLIVAVQGHRGSNKRVMWLLVAVVLLAATLIFLVTRN